MRKTAFVLHQKYGNIVSFITIYAIFSLFLFAAAEPVQAGEVTPTSITITWTSPGDNGISGTAALYDIRYSVTSINSDNWAGCSQAVNEPAPQPCGNPETFTISNLNPDTWYFIAIMTADEAYNWSDLSNIIAVKTLPLSLDVDADENNIPADFHLAQNFPNPFNPSTKIEFSIPVTAHVTISIFNILGQETATILDEIKPAGNYSITWDGVDSYGQKVSSGIYIYRINADDYTDYKKMALVQ
jgi:hypothetical protein